MKSNKLFILLLFAIPLAIALPTVSFSSYYSPNSQMTVTGTCNAANIPVILQINFGGTNIWFDQVSTDSNKKYTFKYTPTTAGTYTLYVGCGGENTNKNFCVGTASSCKAQTKSSSGGGGYGQKCTSNWTCSNWGYCNSSLQQGRTCTDQNLCQKSTSETRSCTSCLESWVCSQWSSCSLGSQSRTCYDEHKCLTTNQKPTISKVCQAPATGYKPAKIDYKLPTPVTTTTKTITPVKKTPKSLWKSLWDNYKWWIIISLITILLIIVILIIYLHFSKTTVEIENIDELKTWVKAELARGTPKENIKALITHHTGWTEEQLHEAFEELKHETGPSNSSPQPTGNQPIQK